jgi:hypothetical protein
MVLLLTSFTVVSVAAVRFTVCPGIQMTTIGYEIDLVGVTFTSEKGLLLKIETRWAPGRGLGEIGCNIYFDEVGKSFVPYLHIALAIYAYRPSWNQPEVTKFGINVEGGTLIRLSPNFFFNIGGGLAITTSPSDPLVLGFKMGIEWLPNLEQLWKTISELFSEESEGAGL